MTRPLKISRAERRELAMLKRGPLAWCGDPSRTRRAQSLADRGLARLFNFRIDVHELRSAT